jgi:ethanolamine utilization protein EutA (predicted chaperonin)
MEIKQIQSQLISLGVSVSTRCQQVIFSEIDINTIFINTKIFARTTVDKNDLTRIPSEHILFMLLSQSFKNEDCTSSLERVRIEIPN